jgi:transcription initiation factor TFIIH subunit 4
LGGEDTEKKGFIIVESNFKVYAYTSDTLYQAILRLFMQEDYLFPNLVVG